MIVENLGILFYDYLTCHMLHFQSIGQYKYNLFNFLSLNLVIFLGLKFTITKKIDLNDLILWIYIYWVTFLKRKKLTWNCLMKTLSSLLLASKLTTIFRICYLCYCRPRACLVLKLCIFIKYLWKFMFLFAQISFHLFSMSCHSPTMDFT